MTKVCFGIISEIGVRLMSHYCYKKLNFKSYLILKFYKKYYFAYNKNVFLLKIALILNSSYSLEISKKHFVQVQ